MRILPPLCLLLSAACMAGEKDVGMTADEVSCTFVRGDGRSAENGEVCAIFRAALTGLDRKDIVSLVLTESSPASARAAALGHDGQELLVLDFDVMDAQLDEAKWRSFARAFAGQLAANTP